MADYCDQLRKWLRASLLMATVATISAGGICGEIQSSISVSVTANNATKAANLVTFTVKNVSSAKVTLHPASMPGASGAVGLLRFYPIRTAIGDAPIQQIGEPANPVGAVELLPGRDISETVDVGRKFPTMLSARNHGEVLLFWSFQPAVILESRKTIQEFPIQGGMVLLPKLASKTK